MIQVILFRLLLSSFIIKYPLMGALIAAVFEFIDLDILMVLETESFKHYQYLDKTLDLYYLGLEAYIASTWKNQLVKKTALVLFAIRFTGTILFLLTLNIY